MLREPRNFLYDDYMDTGMRSAQDDLGIGSSTSRTARSRAMDLELDDYVSRRPTGGYSRHEGPAYGSPSAPQVRRMASALGLPPGRSQASYDDLDYGIPRARSQRVTYRDAPRARIVRRVVDDRDYLDDNIVEVVERVRRPTTRRIQVVRKVPIHQRVVKKIIVQKKIVGRSFGGNRRSVGGGNNAGNRGRIQRVQGRRNTNIQKKQLGGGKNQRGPKKENKPKLSASDLDRELDEYMRGSKHPRVAV